MANDKWDKNPRLNRSRSTAVIQNQEHHDPSSSSRDITGSPGTPDVIISTAATKQPVPEGCVIRVANTNAATQFLFIGEDADAPAGAPVLADGMALPPNSSECFYVGKLASGKSPAIKASSNDVQITVMER